MRLTRCANATSFTLETSLEVPLGWTSRFGDKNLRIENIYFSLSVSLNAGFRERKEGDPASNPYLEAPGETPRAERGRRSLSARITYFFDKVSESFLSFRGGLSLSCPRKLRRCTCTPTYRVYEVSALYLSLRFLLLSLLSSSFFLCFIFNIGTLTKPHRSLPRKKWSKFPSAETGKDAFWISNLMRAV